MNVRKIGLALGATALMAAGTAAAQTPLTYSVNGANFTLYGDVDLYMNYMHSGSGKTIVALQDGAYLRTRIGIRGDKDLGNGFVGKFTFEQGLNDTNGTQADTTRLFDRQAWAGLGTPIGEFRAGRQNGIIFYKGSYVDNTTRWTIVTNDAGSTNGSTSDGGTTSAQFLIMAVGCLSSTNLPDFPGRDTFNGAI